jgi:HEAT repeat protein
MLTRMLNGTDIELARAAAASLGQISGPSATKALRDALVRTKGAVRTAAAEAGLVSAEGLMAQGDRKGALALYDVLSRPDMPKPVRLAAMHSTIEAETSLRRTRPAVK